MYLEFESYKGNFLNSARNSLPQTRDIVSALSLKLKKKRQSNPKQQLMSKLILSDDCSASNSALQNYVQRELSRSSLGLDKNHLNTDRACIKPEEMKQYGQNIHNSNFNLRSSCHTKAGKFCPQEHPIKSNMHNNKKSFSISVLD